MQINLDFTGQVAICTGGASGMGLLSGQKLAASGAKVVLVDINEEGVMKAAEEIRQHGYEATGVVADIRFYDQVEAAAKLAIEKYGQIDILINACGGASARIWKCHDAFRDRDPEIISWGIDVNLKGALYFIRACIGNMLDHNHGVIINFGSVSGEEGSAGCIDYAAAKSAMHGVTKSIASLGAGHNVRSCCIMPGPVLTRAAMANMKTAIGRAAEPWEIVDFILYLCDDTHGGFITGSSHLLDGGRLLAQF